MKLFSSVDPRRAAEIHQQFPLLQRVLEHPHSPRMQGAAISVFDHWLEDEAEWPLLNCTDGPERLARNRKFDAHWAAIFDATEVYAVRYRGRWPAKAKLVLKKYEDRAGFLDACRSRSKRFQFVVLPGFDCIYAESFDDTNILYFNDRARAEPLIASARAAGLHCLEWQSLE